MRAFIPLMLKFSTGRGKPGWGKETTKPPWWPKHVPWANVRMDARNDDEKTKVNNCSEVLSFRIHALWIDKEIRSGRFALKTPEFPNSHF